MHLPGPEPRGRHVHRRHRDDLRRPVQRGRLLPFLLQVQQAVQLLGSGASDACGAH